jgi:hypothetical protein
MPGGLSGQLYAPFALSSRKKPPAHFDKGTGLASEPV